MTQEHALREATREHYEAHPFVKGGRDRVDRWDARLRRLVPGDLLDGCRVLDVGSGSGEVAAALSRRGASVTCLDLTERAARRAASLPGLHPVIGDALHLPCTDGAFDEVISMGVLHHTPDCEAALAECARATRLGGHVTVLLYRRFTLYHLAYLAAAPLRARVPASALTQTPRWVSTLSRPFLRMATGLNYDHEQVEAIIADQLWTPRATFHGTREVRSWARAMGLRIILHERALGYSDTYRLVVHNPARHQSNETPD